MNPKNTIQTSNIDIMPLVNLDTLHPYSRYGLAVALTTSILEQSRKGTQINPTEVSSEKIDNILADEDLIKTVLIKELENCLNHSVVDFESFIVDDKDLKKGNVDTANPHTSSWVSASQLLEDVVSGKRQIGKFGRDYACYVMVNNKTNPIKEGLCVLEALKNTKKSIFSTKSKSVVISKQLSSDGRYNFVLKASSFPFVQKVSVGGEQEEDARATLFEIACGMITTLTAYKPAVFYKPYKIQDWSHYCVIPDIELDMLCRFVAVFIEMFNEFLQDDENSMQFKYVIKSSGDKKNQASLIRAGITKRNFDPSLQINNHTLAVNIYATLKDVIFNIKDRQEVRRVEKFYEEMLHSLANSSLYVIPSNGGGFKVSKINDTMISMFDQNKHFAKLLKQLSSTERSFSKKEQPSGERAILYKSDEEYKGQYQMLFSQLLERFDWWSLKRFLSVKASYPTLFNIILKEMILMNFGSKLKSLPKEGLSSFPVDIAEAAIESISAIGGWAHKSSATPKGSTNDTKKMAQKKIERLLKIESIIRNSKTSLELLSNAFSTISRMRNWTVPKEGKLAMNLISLKKLPLEEAKLLIIAYMWLTPEWTEKEKLEDEQLPEINDTDNHTEVKGE